MKNNLLFLMLIISSVVSFAQSPKFDWVTQEGNASNEKGNQIRRTSNGDLYVTINFIGSTTVGGNAYTQISNSVEGDALICKYNSTGVFQWAKQLSCDHIFAYQIEIDNQGYLYLATTFSGTVTFDGLSYTVPANSTLNAGIFAAQVSNSGSVSWAKVVIQQTVSGVPVIMSVSNTNELLFVCYSQDSIIINNNRYTIGASARMCYVSIFTNGNYNWRTIGDNSEVYYTSLKFYGTSLYGTGRFSGSHTFINNNLVTSNGASDAFLVKYQILGNVQCLWAKSFGSSANEDVEGMELDPLGNIFLFASLGSNTTIGTINLTVPNKTTAIVKFNSSGTCLSATPIINSAAYRPFVGNELRRDNYGNFYASGHFTSSLSITNDTITPSGSWDALIIKIDGSTYNAVWKKQFGGNGIDDVSAVAAGDNELYCTGLFSGVTSFSNITKTASGSYDPFIAKLSGCDFPTVNVTYNGNTTLCNGQTLTLNANTLSGAAYQWLKNDVVLPSQTGTSLLVAGAGTYSIDVNLGGVCRDTFGLVAVTVSNPNATIQSAQPSVCPGGSLQLYTNLPFSSYNWSTGVSTPTITVSQQGTYSVTITDGSGCLDTATLAIGEYTPPTVPTVLQGANCQLASSVIQNGYSYKWRLNGNIVGNNSAYLDVTIYGSGFYTIEVTDPNGCKSSSATPVSITLPPTPTITNNSGILTSSSSTGNQWYFNGSLLASQTSQSLSPTQSGDYYVIVTDGNGCSSQSTTVNFTFTGIDNNTNTSFSIYPNPTNGLFMLSFYTNSEKSVTISCTNLLGQTVFNKQLEVVNGQQNIELNLSSMSKGIYLVRLEINGKSIYRKVTISE